MTSSFAAVAQRSRSLRPSRAQCQRQCRVLLVTCQVRCRMPRLDCSDRVDRAIASCTRRPCSKRRQSRSRSRSLLKTMFQTSRLCMITRSLAHSPAAASGSRWSRRPPRPATTHVQGSRCRCFSLSHRPGRAGRRCRGVMLRAKRSARWRPPGCRQQVSDFDQTWTGSVRTGIGCHGSRTPPVTEAGQHPWRSAELLGSDIERPHLACPGGRQGATSAVEVAPVLDDGGDLA